MVQSESRRLARSTGEDGDELIREFETTLRDALEEFEAFRRRYFGSRGEGEHPGTPSALGARPFADVEDHGSDYEVHVDLPGVPKDRIEVKIVGQSLIITGEAHGRRTAPERPYVLRERFIGGFHREIVFPDPVVGSEVRASFDNGVLSVHVPKVRPPVEHRVPIP